MNQYVMSFMQFLNEARNVLQLDGKLDISEKNLNNVIKDPDFRKKYANVFMTKVIKNVELKENGCYSVNKSEADYGLFFYDKEKENDPNDISFYIKDDIKAKSDNVFAFALASPQYDGNITTYEIIKNEKGENAVFCFEYDKVWIGRMKNNRPEIFMSTSQSDIKVDMATTGNISLFITNGYLTLELASFKVKSIYEGEIDINKVDIVLSNDNASFMQFTKLLTSSFKNNYIYIRYNAKDHYVIIGQESTVGGRQGAYEKAKTAKNVNGDWEWIDNDSILIKKHTDKEIHKALIRDITRANDNWHEMIEYDQRTSEGQFHTCEGFKILPGNDDLVVINKLQDYIITFAKGSFSKKNTVVFAQRENQKKYSSFFDKLVNEQKSEKILINAVPRFGKTAQTLFSCIRQKDAHKILVLSGQPTNVKNAWRDELYKFDFGAGFDFYEKNDVDENAIDELNDIDNKFMLFISLQSAGKDVDQEGNQTVKDVNSKTTQLLERIDFDTVIVDECHFAASTVKSKTVIDRLMSRQNPPLLVELSGTPYKKIRSNEYKKDQVFSYTVLDDYRDNHDAPDYVHMNFVSYDHNAHRDIKRPSGNSRNTAMDMVKRKKEFFNFWDTDRFSWDDYFEGEIKNGEQSIDYFTSNILSPRMNMHMKENNVTNIMVVVSQTRFGDLIRKRYCYDNYSPNSGIDIVNLCGGANIKPADLDARLFENKFINKKPTIIFTCGTFCTGTTLRYLDAICWCESCKSPEKLLQYSMRVCSKYDESDFTKRKLKPQTKTNGFIYVFGNGMTVDLKASLNEVRRNIIESSEKFKGTDSDIRLSNASLPIWEMKNYANGSVDWAAADDEEILTDFNKYNAFSAGDTADYIKSTKDFDFESIGLSLSELFSTQDSTKTKIVDGDEDVTDKPSSKPKPSNKPNGGAPKEEGSKSESEKIRECIIEALKRVPYLMHAKKHNITSDEDFINLYDGVDSGLYGLDKESAKKVLATIGNKELLYSKFNASYRSLNKQDEAEVTEKFMSTFVAPTFKKKKIVFQEIKDILYKKEDVEGKRVMTLCSKLSNDNKIIEDASKNTVHFVWVNNKTKNVSEDKVYSYQEYINENSNAEGEYNISEKVSVKDVIGFSDIESANKMIAESYKLKNVVYVKSLKELEEKLNNMPKFDIAIMNPPYDGNLHLKILEKVIPVAKEVVNISPIDWLLNCYGGNVQRQFSNIKFTDIKRVGLLSDIFDNTDHSTYTAGIYYIDKSANKTCDYFKTKFITADGINMINETILKSIINKTSKCDNLENKIHTGKIDENTNYVIVLPKLVGNPGEKVDRLYWRGGRWDKIFYKGEYNGKRPSEIKKKLNNVKNYDSFDYIEFDTKIEAENWIKSSETTFIRFMQVIQSVDANRRCNHTPFMNDYSKPWTNERFCEYFGITDEEWKEIEETMRQFN